MNLNSVISNRAFRTTSLGVMLALSVAVIAGCNGAAAENMQPPPPAVSVAPVLVKQISQWD
ncbi:MAG: efflux transporter periplasmic adaptor subunit, partial [Pseudoxanthomonas sp.]